jgi:hypothetical protein
MPALADALHHLLSAPERLADMGQAARVTVLGRFGEDRFDAIASEILGRVAELGSDRGNR